MLNDRDLLEPKPRWTRADADRWLQTFGQDPERYDRRILGINPYDLQLAIQTSVRDNRRTACKAGNAVGKSYITAATIAWFLQTRWNAKVLVTAPTARQVRRVLWAQLKALHYNAPEPLGGELLEWEWRLGPNWWGLGFATREAEKLQGFHAPTGAFLVVADEASGINDDVMQALDSLMTSERARMLLIGNPTRATGFFADAFQHPGRALNYHKITISCLDTPNIREGKTVIPGLCSQVWLNEIRNQYGEDSDYWRVHVLGEFPVEPAWVLIPISWLEAARIREIPEDLSLRKQIGVDIADEGASENALYVRRGPCVLRGEFWKGLGLMNTANRIAQIIDEETEKRHGRPLVKIDTVGLGKGPYDRLIQMGYGNCLQQFMDGTRSSQPERWRNIRDEAYCAIRERHRTGDIGIPEGSLGQPYDDKLVRQLAAMSFDQTEGRQQLVVESKKKARARGLPSPDRADALVIAFWEHREVPVLFGGLARQ